MGVDLYLCEDPCKTCNHQPICVADESYTYNVSRMWYKVYPADKYMVQIEGMKGKQAYKKLAHAKKVMEENKEEFEAMNPLNGWGSYEGFLGFIEKLMKHSLDYPKIEWSACR